MTLTEVADLIESFGLPFAYHHFTNATAKEPPFVVYYYPGNDDFRADNANYVNINQLTIELYTDNKEFTLEGTIEAALTAADIPYTKTEDWIESEKMYMVTYDTEVLING